MESPASQSLVLLIEGDQASARVCRERIEALGATCCPVNSVEQAQAILLHNAPDVVVVDYDLPDGTGVDLIALLRQHLQHRTTPILLLTGEISANELERAVMMGIYAFLAKPFSPAEFTKLVSAAIADEAQRVRNRNV